MVEKSVKFPENLLRYILMTLGLCPVSKVGIRLRKSHRNSPLGNDTADLLLDLKENPVIGRRRRVIAAKSYFFLVIRL